LIKNIIVIGAIALLVFAGLYFLCQAGVEPVKTYAGPYVDQAVDGLNQGVEAAKAAVTEYTAAIPTMVIAGAGGVVGLIQKYAKKEIKTVKDAAEMEKIQLETQVNQIFRKNLGLEEKNMELNARIEKLSDVEANMNKLKEENDKLIHQVDRLTAERNEAERLRKIVEDAINPLEVIE